MFKKEPEALARNDVAKRKRLLLFFGCLAAVVLAGYGTLRLTVPRHRITGHNIQTIELGMTEVRVKEILGAEAGDYSTKRLELNWSRKAYGKFWIADEAAIWVGFDETGQVAAIIYGWGLREPESFLANLRRWLGM